MHRDEFREVARRRLGDARALLKAKRFDAAYYLSGIAIECALKACLAKKTKRYTFPPPHETVRNSYYIHELTKLLKAAGLAEELDRAGPAVNANWAVIRDWRVETRYDLKDRREAESMYKAITARNGGILRWVQTYW